jgi:hypothetical protein
LKLKTLDLGLDGGVYNIIVVAVVHREIVQRECVSECMCTPAWRRRDREREDSRHEDGTCSLTAAAALNYLFY